MPSVVGRILRRFVLAPRVKKLNWDQLRNGSLEVANRFIARIAGITDEAADVEVGGFMSIRDMVAHLALTTGSVASRLEALRDGRPQPDAPPNLWPGAGEQSLEWLLEEFSAALSRFEAAASTPIINPQPVEHDFFGPIRAPEWVALIAYHCEYHGRQVDRIMRSPEFRSAQGSQF